jgi:hypothetical protein
MRPPPAPPATIKTSPDVLPELTVKVPLDLNVWYL